VVIFFLQFKFKENFILHFNYDDTIPTECYLCFFEKNGMTNKEAYQQFCKKEKEVPIFSQPWYLDVICGIDGWDIMMIKKGDEIAVTMPIQKKNILGFQLPRMPHPAKYLGPYFPKKFRSIKQQEKLMRQLIKQLPKFDFFEQNFNPSIINWLPFHWENFEATTRYTFTIDLNQKTLEIFQNIDSKYRNNKITKAQKIVQVTTDKSLQDFFNIQSKTFERQKMKVPFSFDFFKKYDAVLNKQNAREIFFAIDKDDQIHSVLYLIWDKDTAYLHIAGDDPKLRSSGASILLTWHAIKHAKEVLQKNIFDFEGSMIEPIAKVRQSFGGQQTPYFLIKKYNSKLIKFLHQLKQ